MNFQRVLFQSFEQNVHIWDKSKLLLCFQCLVCEPWWSDQGEVSKMLWLKNIHFQKNTAESDLKTKQTKKNKNDRYCSKTMLLF